MKSFLERAYALLVQSWGVDGDHDLLSVADALHAQDRNRAIREIDRQIEFTRAKLRAYLTLRSALVAQDRAAIESMRDTNLTDIDSWPVALEKE